VRFSKAQTADRAPFPRDAVTVLTDTPVLTTVTTIAADHRLTDLPPTALDNRRRAH
jgi:hypothetical protein